MLNRIDTIYRFCKKNEFGFVMPGISSRLHNQNYDHIFGLSSISPRVEDWKGSVVTIEMHEIEDAIKQVHEIGVLFSIKYNHEYSSEFIKKNYLYLISGFDYAPYLKIAPKIKDIDYLIHLRLGDNFIYRLPDNLYFDSGKRRIIRDLDLMGNEYSIQWNVSQVELIIKELEARNLSYRIHCDGVDSAVRHIRWSKDPDHVKYAPILLQSVKSFEVDLIERVSFGNKNVVLDSADVLAPINDLFRAKTLVFTNGGFLKSVNKFWNPNPAKKMNFSDFYFSLVSNKGAL